MSSASDYYGGSNAPQTSNYGAPQLDFSGFTNLLDTFTKGRKEGREEDQARAFRNGIPTDTGGNADYGKMSETMLRMGNYPAAASMQQTGIQLQQLRNAGNLGNGLIGPGSAAGAPGAPAAAPAAGGAVDDGSAPAPQAAAVPAATPRPPHSVGGSPNAPNSIISLLPDNLSPEATGVMMSKFQNLFKVNDPNAPLTPGQASIMRNQLANLNPSQAGAGSDAAPPAIDAAGGGVPLPAPRPADAPATPAQRFDAARPSGVSPAGMPAPAVPAAPAPQMPDPQRVAQTVQATGIAPNAAAALESRLDAMPVGQRKAYLNQLATSPAFPKSVNDWAEARTKQLEQDTAPTTEQKNYAVDKLPGETMSQQQARASAMKETANKDVETYSKKYESIQKSAQEASIELPKIELAKQFLNSPNFYSGPLETTNRLFKQFQASFPGSVNPNKALDQEGFGKIVSDMLTSQIKSLGASGAGPVRIAEVQNMKKAVANLGLTPVTNRLLVEMFDRSYRDVQAIAGISRQYEANPNNVPGKKNLGLDTAIQKYYDTHPMFSEAEKRDPRLIAPPEFANSTEAFNAHLPKGQPVKIGGQMKWVQ